MECRELGKTGVMLPEVGIGTWQYQGGPDLLRHAVDHGAFLIDTAEFYRNEEVVGQAIRGIRDQVFLATKTHHWRRADVLQSAESSLRKLGTDRIDLYQLHWPNGAVPVEETFGALETLVTQGKVRFLGISNFSNGETRRVFSVLQSERLVSNQMRYSLIERTIEPRILPFCRDHHMTVLAYSPLGHRFPSLLQADRGGALERIARDRGKTPAQVALNWCLSREGVVVIPKTESLEHLKENCAASGWRLTEEEVATLGSQVRYRRRSEPEAFLRRLVRNQIQRYRRWRRGGRT